MYISISEEDVASCTFLTDVKTSVLCHYCFAPVVKILENTYERVSF